MRIITSTLREIVDFYRRTGSCVFYKNGTLATDPELSREQIDSAVYDGEFWTVDDVKLKVFLFSFQLPLEGYRTLCEEPTRASSPKQN